MRVVAACDCRTAGGDHNYGRQRRHSVGATIKVLSSVGGAAECNAEIKQQKHIVAAHCLS
jgi:hypothetical protein